MSRPRTTATAAGAATGELPLTYDRRSAARGARDAAALFDPLTVSLEPGIALVEASAGTGKTFCITLTVLRLLLDRDAAGAYRAGGIGRILVVTFTNAATDELITRLRRTLRDAVDVFAGIATPSDANAPIFRMRDHYGAAELPRLRAALAELDQLSVFTIHGFCRRVLEESALESGTPFDATFLEDDALLVERVAQDWWRRTIYEDGRLATLAVHEEWKWDAFLRDLRSFRRWPQTRLDPDIALPAAMRALDAAVAAFGKLFDAPDALAFLERQSWRRNAPLADPAMRSAVVDAAAALASGDVARGLAAVKACTTAAIQHRETGIRQQTKVEKAAFASVPDARFVRACDSVAAALAPVQQALRVSCLREVEGRFVAEKERRHLLGFDDLLRRLRDAITAEGTDGHLARAIRRRYDAALIDEFQDTDPFQFPIFSTAFSTRPLFLIGDPKQAIYGFRGADIFAYMDAAERADRHYTLRDNWRSTARHVSAVNALFGRRPAPFLYEAIPYLAANAARDPDDPLAGDGLGAMHWWFVPPVGGAAVGKGVAEARVQDAVVREIARLLTPARDGRSPRVRPGGIAVLVRWNYEGEALRERLTRAGVPSVLAGTGDILQSRELLELERVLRAVARPHHAPTVRAALATEMWGLDATAIHQLSLPDHEGEWEAIVDRLVAAGLTWSRHGFMRMSQELIATHGVAERLLGHSDGERRLTNLRHAVELLHGVATEERFSPDALLLWIGRSRARNDQDAESKELRLESDADAVQIVTIHKSKGLEYDVVFCPSLYLSRPESADAPITVHLHDARRTVVFDHGSAERAARGRLAAAERLAEDLRLAYVALTRARFRTYVAWGAAENKTSGGAGWSSALGYLLRASVASGAPEDVVEQVAAGERQTIGDWFQRLQELAAVGGDGVMTVEELTEAVADARTGAEGAREPGVRAGAHAPPGSVASRTPAPRQVLPTRTQLDTWRIASFTSLTAGRHADDSRDLADVPATGFVAAAERAGLLARGDFMAFPAGRQAGIALHELFERVVFAASTSAIRALARDVLTRHRFLDGDGDARLDAVCAMTSRVLGAGLPGAGFPLAHVAAERTLREWGFHLPLRAIDGATLAGAFATHGDELARRYAPSLSGIAPVQVHGFLTGVVDLAFEHDSRWHVIDWKSNHLGTDPASYDPEALEPEMFASHYVLQYHLYVTALHRFLRLRVPGYAYETHVGTVWYAFLRGIDGTARGWHAHRPAPALIHALDALMGPASLLQAGA